MCNMEIELLQICKKGKYLYVLGKSNLTEIIKYIFLKTLQVNIDQIRVKQASLCDV